MGVVEVSFNDFITSFEWNWGSGSTQETPLPGEKISENNAGNTDGQVNFTLLSRNSFFGNDQTAILDSIAGSASNASPIYLYFRSGTRNYFRQKVEAAYYYSSEQYYTFVGRTEHLIGTTPRLSSSEDWVINTAGVEYVSPTGSGVNGSFTAQSGEIITVVDGIITSIV